jgi:hypothetical protein
MRKLSFTAAHRGEGEFSAVRQEIRSLEEALRAEMRALNDHTLTQVRVLHEEVIDRLARLDESGGARRSNGRRKRR